LLIGQAIDDVAEWHQRADAALTIVAPGHSVDALRAAQSLPSSMAPGGANPFAATLRYSVPVHEKQDGKIMVAKKELIAVNPFGACSDAREVHDVTDGMKRALGDDPQIESKRRNTLEFLTAAREAWRKPLRSSRI
jgi:hypothetical protein